MPPNLIGFAWLESDLSSKTREAEEVWDLQNYWSMFSLPSMHFIHMCFNILQVYLKVKEPVFHQVILKNYYTFDCLTVLACLVFSFSGKLCADTTSENEMVDVLRKLSFKAEIANSNAYRSQI